MLSSFLSLAPASSRLVLSLLGYSLLSPSTFDPLNLNKSIVQIGNLLTKTVNVEQFDDENQTYNQTSLKDFELGRLIGCGCNAAVYEARLRTSNETNSTWMTLSNSVVHQDQNDCETDIEILSHQSSNSSSVDDETYDHLDDEERLNELTLKEGKNKNLHCVRFYFSELHQSSIDSLMNFFFFSSSISSDNHDEHITKQSIACITR